MSTNLTRLSIAFVSTAFLVCTTACSKDSVVDPPVAPSGCTPTVSQLALSGSLTAGNTTQGTVTLSCAPSGSVSVALSSSDASASVPGSVVVAGGSTTGTFTVTANSPGTPTITVSINGTSRTASLTITGSAVTVTLANMTLASSTVTGGNTVQGTVTLSGAAPAGGTTVPLSSSDPGVGTVPSSVSVAAGATTATFTVTTRAVGGTIPITVSATLAGVTRTASLSVLATATPLAANFRVTSNVNNAVNTCQLASNGQNLNCTYDGSSSTSPNGFREFQWTWQLPTRSVSTPTTSSQLVSPSTNGCQLFLDLDSRVKASGNPIQLTVRLIVVDTNGTRSNEAINANVQILPTNGACGFNF